MSDEMNHPLKVGFGHRQDSDYIVKHLCLTHSNCSSRSMKYLASSFNALIIQLTKIFDTMYALMSYIIRPILSLRDKTHSSSIALMATGAAKIQSCGYFLLTNFDYEHRILIYLSDLCEIGQKCPINLDLF